MLRSLRFLITAFTLGSVLALHAAEYSDIPTTPTEGDKMLDEYFLRDSRRVTNRTKNLIEKTTDWPKAQEDMRRQLYEMLGLQPMPPRTPLKAKVTGTTERDGVIVENIVFQSRPGLYVTANFYRPAKAEGPLPTILYVCGHGPFKKDGVSYGNKVTYQHHGAMFAKNGYNCFIVDTLQMGEIEGTHHGTHHLDRWWWNSRGYVPTGVEVWNNMRALDYLETRPEVDKEKFGITGRSGGGSYSLWTAAAETRLKVAAPTAGVTSMHNQIVDGCIEGHCDCMFMLNTYRWDFPLAASLIAPRALMILNTDKDRIFPLDGVVDVYLKTRKVYDAMGEQAQIGFAAYEGPHLDTQPLRVSALHWFNRKFKGADLRDQIEDTVAPKLFEPEELKVLKEIPKDEKNTRIDELFVRRVPKNPELPNSPSDWEMSRERIKTRLKSRVFHGWPFNAPELQLKEEVKEEKDGIAFSRLRFQSQVGVNLPLYIAHPSGASLDDANLVVLNTLDDEGWDALLAQYGAAFPKIFSGVTLPEQDQSAYEKAKKRFASERTVIVYLAPRGVGPTAWTTDENERIHIRRRFALLGTTLDSMRIWDMRRAVQSIRSLKISPDTQLWLRASGVMAGNALHVPLFEKDIHRLILRDMPSTYQDGPELLNVLRFAEIPEVAAIVGENSQLLLLTSNAEPWKNLVRFSEQFSWPEDQLMIRPPHEKDAAADESTVKVEAAKDATKEPSKAAKPAEATKEGAKAAKPAETAKQAPKEAPVPKEKVIEKTPEKPATKAPTP